MNSLVLATIIAVIIIVVLFLGCCLLESASNDNPYAQGTIALLVFGLFVGFIWLIIGLFNQSAQDDKNWNTFVVEHHCRVTSSTSGTNSIGVLGGKIGTVYTPGKTVYACDGNETYSR